MRKLHRSILAHRPQIKKALFDDYRKHPSEVDLTEIYPVVRELKHAKRGLRQWMKDLRVGTPLALAGSNSWVRFESKGVVLIGGSCINHNALHFFNFNLPFGGSNQSGMGNGHGHYGFQAFSNQRGILKQHIPGALELLIPPYNRLKQKIIDLTIKYF